MHFSLQSLFDDHSGSFENMVSLEMEQKLNLETIVHPTPYKLRGLQQGAEIKVSTRCLVSFSIGNNYHDQVWCDVATMDASHILLGRPWLYDNRVILMGLNIPMLLKRMVIRLF